MFNLKSVATAWVLLLAAAVHSQTPSTAPALSPELADAIRGFSSDTFKVRQASYRKVVELGAPALPALKELVASTKDIDVRNRAGAAIKAIEDNNFVGASKITLKLKDAPPADVFAALAKQARCELVPYPANLFTQQGLGTITLNVEDADFWSVLKDACKQSGVGPMQMGNERRISLGRGSNPGWSGPSVLSGPFMIAANRIYRQNSVDLSGPAGVQTDFQMQFTIFAEPKLRILQSSYVPTILEAVDDKGNSLKAESTQHGYSGGNQWMWNLSARLNYPENAGKRIARIKGQAKFTVQTKAETIDIPDILKATNINKTIAGKRIVIKELKQSANQQYQLAITVFLDGSNANELNIMGAPGTALRILDGQGKSLAYNGGGGGGGDKLEYNFHFSRQNWGGDDQKIGEPARLVWEFPTETRELIAPFEFTDLPLP